MLVKIYEVKVINENGKCVAVRAVNFICKKDRLSYWLERVHGLLKLPEGWLLEIGQDANIDRRHVVKEYNLSDLDEVFCCPICERVLVGKEKQQGIEKMKALGLK